MSEYEDNRPMEYTFSPDGSYHTEPVKRKKKKYVTTGKLIAVALCCSLIGGILGAGGVLFGARLFSGGDALPESGRETVNIIEGRRRNAVTGTEKADTSGEMTPAQVYAANVDSTVGITTSITTTNFWGYQSSAAASGSGFILSDNGYIITNYHVIEDSNSVTVTTYSGQSYEAEIVGFDESNDIAVLKIEAESLVPVVLGSSDELQVGDFVEAIGNPLGELTFSMTYGAVSALDREVTLSNGVTMKLIQTDCAINSGNSGGALFNMYGEVIGITNAKYSSGGSGASIDNIGFAIPIDSVRDIVESIIEKGYITKPYIGVSVASVGSESQAYGLPGGAAVKAVTEGGPAEKAGLQVNDIITAVDGVEITSHSDLVDYVGQKSVGDTISLTVYRQGTYITVNVTVGEEVRSATEKKADESQQNQQGQQYYDFGFPFGFSFPFGF